MAHPHRGSIGKTGKQWRINIAKMKKFALAGKISAPVFQKCERVLKKAVMDLDSHEKRQREEMMASTQDGFRKLFEQKAAKRVKGPSDDELLPEREVAG